MGKIGEELIGLPSTQLNNRTTNSVGDSSDDTTGREDDTNATGDGILKFELLFARAAGARFAMRGLFVVIPESFKWTMMACCK